MDNLEDKISELSMRLTVLGDLNIEYEEEIMHLKNIIDAKKELISKQGAEAIRTMMETVEMDKGSASYSQLKMLKYVDELESKARKTWQELLAEEISEEMHCVKDI